MDLKYNVFGKSIYSLKEMELIKLACEWVKEAEILPSISWAQMTYGEDAVGSIDKILKYQSAPYHFEGHDNIFPTYIFAIKYSVEMYNDFCRYAPPYFFNKTSNKEIEKVIDITKNFNIKLKKEYFMRFTMLEEILVKLQEDIEFFENNSNKI